MPVIGSGWEVPAEADTIGDFRWWKVRGMRSLVLVILSHEPVWYRGHFYKGKMVPCFGEGCVLCADGVGAQLRYVFAGAEPYTRQVGLMEVGRTIGLELKDFARRHGQWRGCVVEFSKHSRSEKSRMEVKYVETPVAAWWGTLPIPDIAKALKLTWQRSGATYQDDVPDQEVDTEARPWEKFMGRQAEEEATV